MRLWHKSRNLGLTLLNACLAGVIKLYYKQSGSPAMIDIIRHYLMSPIGQERGFFLYFRHQFQIVNRI